LSEGCSLDVDDRFVALVGVVSLIFKGRLDFLAPTMIGGLDSAISLSSLGVDRENADAHGVVFFVLGFSIKIGHSSNVVQRDLG
jgi:hypothetical protein